jgi:predicted branched-subunit amino acid permease
MARRDDRAVGDEPGDPATADDPVGPDVDPGPDSATDPETASAADRVRSRLAAPFSSLFSLRLFLVVLALCLVGMVLGSTLVPLPGAGLAGIAVAGFVVGLARDDRRYLELLLAGIVASAAGVVFEYALVVLVGGLAPVAFGTAAGAIAAVAGHYFGRDLRHGLLREV